MAFELEVKMSLECLVCKDFIVGPITKCVCKPKRKNHLLIDGICQEVSRKCPYCNCEPDSLVVTSVLQKNPNWENTEMPCWNTVDGCSRRFKPRDMEEHLTTCDFRSIRCTESTDSRSGQCGREYSPRNLFKHLVDDHKIFKIDLDVIHPLVGPTHRSKLVASFKIFSLRLDLDSKGNRVVNWPVYYFDVNGCIFFLHIHHNDQFEVLHIWITYLGAEAEAKGYKYSGELRNDLSKAKPIKFQDILVHSVQYNEITKIQGLGHSFTMAVSYSDLAKFQELKKKKMQIYGTSPFLYIEHDWPEWHLQIQVFKRGIPPN